MSLVDIMIPERIVAVQDLWMMFLNAWNVAVNQALADIQYTGNLRGMP